jgi:hypothetical protein
VKWEVKKDGWDLAADDFLALFLGTLGLPIVSTLTPTLNGRGGPADIMRLTFGEAVGNAPVYFHGTTHFAVRDILAHGFIESSNPSIHEFTTPGVYVTNSLDSALFYHAVATKFTSVPTEDTPYVRLVLTVQCTGTPRKRSSYGGHDSEQMVYAADQLKVIDLLVFRGWHFIDKGEKVMTTSWDTLWTWCDQIDAEPDERIRLRVMRAR